MVRNQSDYGEQMSQAARVWDQREEEHAAELYGLRTKIAASKPSGP